MSNATVNDINLSRMLPGLADHLQILFRNAVDNEVLKEVPAFALVVCSDTAEGTSGYVCNLNPDDLKKVIEKLNERLQSGAPHIPVHERH